MITLILKLIIAHFISVEKKKRSITVTAIKKGGGNFLAYPMRIFGIE